MRLPAPGSHRLHSSPWASLLGTFHVSEGTHHVAVCVSLLSLSVQFSRFIHGVACWIFAPFCAPSGGAAFLHTRRSRHMRCRPLPTCPQRSPPRFREHPAVSCCSSPAYAAGMVHSDIPERAPLWILPDLLALRRHRPFCTCAHTETLPNVELLGARGLWWCPCVSVGLGRGLPPPTPVCHPHRSGRTPASTP